jgi:hypothetical protein
MPSAIDQIRQGFLSVCSTMSSFKPRLAFVVGPVDLNTKLRKVLAGGYVTIGLLKLDIQ